MAIIKGTAGIDTLVGTDTRDVINGLAGADTMIGGLGNDTYFVDDFFDVITEDIGAGTDWVHSTVTYTLGADVEHGRLLGTADINMAGNDGDNTLYGNRGDNSLSGGLGADALFGGAGDDTYTINQFAANGINDRRSGGDYIVDTSGNDTVTAFGLTIPDLAYIMQRGLENLTFTSPITNLTITGNASKNIITTSGGDDVIDGGRNADTMDGGDGANTFIVDHKNDLIIDTDSDFDGDNLPDDATADTVLVRTNYVLSPTAQVENIIIDGTRAANVTGSDTRNFIVGNEKRNIMRGGGGDDVIEGGLRDVLYGDAGADTFIVNEDFLAEDGPRLKPPVTLMDFNIGDGDALDISNIIEFEDGDILASYVDIVDRGRDSHVRINPTGDGDPRSFFTVAIIKGITGLSGEVALVADGALIVTEA